MKATSASESILFLLIGLKVKCHVTLFNAIVTIQCSIAQLLVHLKVASTGHSPYGLAFMGPIRVQNGLAQMELPINSPFRTYTGLISCRV